MSERWETKRPSEVRTYKIDWSAFLGSDTIASRTTTASGVTIDNGAGQGVIDVGGKGITFKLSGGTNGTLARITNTIVTAAGETETEKVVLFISDFAEPVSLALAKANSRVTDTSEDALIENYIRAAREWVENDTGHILLRRPLTKVFSEFYNYFELPYRPVTEVISISYTDSLGAVQSILPISLSLSTNSYPYRVRHNDVWPSGFDYAPVTVSFVAGYDEGEVPQIFIQAMLVLVEGMRQTRGSISPDTERTAKWLCDQHRSIRVA